MDFKISIKGEKEVLIKSMASTLPTYIMSCFRLPRSLIAKLTSAVARLWWRSNGNQRRLHWMAWNKCKPKSVGGLGYRILEDFNSALLAKQLWRLIDHPKLLFAKIFKGMYYRNTDPVEQVRLYSPLYG